MIGLVSCAESVSSIAARRAPSGQPPPAMCFVVHSLRPSPFSACSVYFEVPHSTFSVLFRGHAFGFRASGFGLPSAFGPRVSDF